MAQTSDAFSKVLDHMEPGWREHAAQARQEAEANMLREAGTIDAETLERHRWALEAAAAFMVTKGGNPDVVKSLLVLAEWGQ